MAVQRMLSAVVVTVPSTPELAYEARVEDGIIGDKNDLYFLEKRLTR
jgi:hypothetical protein